MFDAGFAQRIWFDAGPVAAVLRAALTPAERLFGGIVGVRDILYDAGWLPAHDTRIPAISVGNLTVGGTGKTPIAAWIARGLRERGAKPAIVLRGYGDDEPLVHRALNPDVPVLVDADRAAAIDRAAAQGADIAVLDDAFQYRRVERVADLVLVSADRWTSPQRLLPAGPWREPLSAVRRASLVVVTRKAASDALVEAVNQELARVAPAVPRVSVGLHPGDLVAVHDIGARRAIESLSGARVGAVLSIADPMAFLQQLASRGVRTDPEVFPDHHAFTAPEVAVLVKRLRDMEMVVCTLKDAVKLSAFWPRPPMGPALWYVSQHVMVERGVGGLERVLDDVVRARSDNFATTAT